MDGMEDADSIAHQIALMESYDMAYGICDHETDPSPLSLVRMHPSEDLEDSDPLFKRITQFRKRNVRRIYGIDLPDFLQLPKDVVEYILKDAVQENVSELEGMGETNELLSGLKQWMKQNK